MTKDKSPINFDKTIAGFNVTEDGEKFMMTNLEDQDDIDRLMPDSLQ